MGRNKNEKGGRNGKSDNLDYPVGYKRPPLHTRFKTGQSGNKKGRPKKLATFADVILKQLRKIVTISIGGKVQKISMLEAIALKHVSQAANGNHKSTALLLDLLKPTEDDRGNHLPELLQELRSQDAANESADRVSFCLTDANPDGDKTETEKSKVNELEN
jgi:hypothetical protein